MPSVSVIIPARNAEATLGATLDALARQTVAHEVVVADDGSTDATAALARAAGATVVRVAGLPGAPGGGMDVSVGYSPPERTFRPLRGSGAGSRGPGAARNAGAAVAGGDVLAFTDADCVPAPDWLERGLAALDDADLVQGRVEPDPAAPRHPFDRTVSVPAMYGLFESANLLMTRALFDRLGGFGDGIADPGKHLAEDVFLGWDARRAGARLVFAHDAVVHHAVFARDWRGFVGERARLRHFPAIVKVVPELRDGFLRHRVFLTAETPYIDLALLGLLTRHRHGLLAAVPYAVRLRRRARQWPREATLPLAAAFLAADAVGAAALLYGSVTQRCPVL